MRNRRATTRSANPRLWWVPVAVFLVILVAPLFGLSLEQLLAGLVALHLLVRLVRRPDMALRLLVIILPFQLMITAWLYQIGFPGPIVRMAGLWKELAVLAVIAAAWGLATREGHRLDALDRCALAYGLLGTTYMVVPTALVGPLGASLSFDLRFVAWRALVLPVVILIAVRHVRLSQGQVTRLFHTVIVVGTVIGGLAVFEFVASGAWNRLMVDTLGVNRFRTAVLQVDPTELGGAVDDIRTYGAVAGRSIVRVGGPMASYLQLSFVLLIALAVLLERLVQGRRAPLAVAGTALAASGLLFTQTRSSIVGGCVLLVATLRPGPGRSGTSRVRFITLAGLAAILVVPLVFSAGLADRFTSGDVESDDVHDIRFDAAVDTVQEHPLGLGLGMGASGSQGAEGAVIPENQLLDVGVQLGVGGMALIVAVLLLLIRTLRGAADRTSDIEQKLGTMGSRNAVIALLVPCWYLQPLGTPEVGWVLFALAGAALGAVDREEAPRSRAVTVGVSA